MDNQDWGRNPRRRQELPAPAMRTRADESASGSTYPSGWGGSAGDDWSVERSQLERRQGPRRRWRSLVVVVAALLVIIGGAGGVGISRGHWFLPAGTTSARPTATPGPIQPLLTIDTSASETCPTGIAWSPDALKIAVAADGEQSQCDTADPGRTQAVTLYDTRLGAQLKRVSVYLTLEQLKISANNAYAGQPSWSPDGSTIVLPFALLDTTEPAQHSGLLVIPVNSGAPRVLIDTTDTQLVHPIWNLKTGKLVAVQTKALPQALTYSWNADGSIKPAEATPPRSSTDYTGSPVAKAGSTSFSRWRSGTITPVLREGYLGAPFAWFHTDMGALWSPNGQYVAPDYSIETRLPEPVGGAPTPAQLQPQDSVCAELALSRGGETSDVSLATSYCGQNALPYPDAAYAAVVAQARAGVQVQGDSGHIVTEWIPVEVAWRTDGKVLATMLPADDFAAHHSSVRVTLYDTATGEVLTTLSQQVTQPGSQTNAPLYLSWSPTGQQLALVNDGDSQIFVWGASSLASLPSTAR